MVEKTNHPYGPGSHVPLADKHEMPACYPIKGNANSMLYHRPDSRDYAQTIAEVWFDSPTAAEEAGFTLSPSHPDGADATIYEPGGSEHPCSAAAVAANRSIALGTAGPATSGTVTVDGDSSAGGIGAAGLAAGAAAAGAAGAAAAGLSGMVGDADVPDVDLPDVDLSAGATPTIDAPSLGDAEVDVDKGGVGLGGVAAAGAAGVAGAAGLASAGRDKISGAGASAGAAASAAGDRVSGGLKGAAGAATGAAAATGASVRGAVSDDGDDDDGGLAGCLARWWWLALLLVGAVILALLLSQCGGSEDDDATASTTPTTEAAETATTEAETTTTTEAETTTTTEAETTTTTEAETTTTTEAEPEVLTLAGVAEGASPQVFGLLGPLGLSAALDGDGPFTLFLPSDEGALAVLAENPDLLTEISADPAMASSVLGYHLVPGTYSAEDLADGATLTTSTGLELIVADGAVNGIEITSVDLEGSNGVIHVINGVLFPPASPELAVTGASSELLGALGAALVISGAGMVLTARRREEAVDVSA